MAFNKNVAFIPSLPFLRASIPVLAGLVAWLWIRLTFHNTS